MRSTGNPITVSMAQLVEVDGRLVFADEAVADQHFGLMVEAYENAFSWFDRNTLRSFPPNTTVFIAWDGETMAGTTAVKVAYTLGELDDLLEVEIPVLRQAMVRHAMQTLGDSPVRHLKAVSDALEAIVRRHLLDEMLHAAGMGNYLAIQQQHEDGRLARIELPMGVSARAATAPSYHGINKLLRLKVLEWAQLVELAGLCGLNAVANGLPASLGKLGYTIVPIEAPLPRAIFPGEQAVNWLLADQSRAVRRLLAQDLRRRNARPAQWALDTRHAITLLGGEV